MPRANWTGASTRSWRSVAGFSRDGVPGDEAEPGRLVLCRAGSAGDRALLHGSGGGGFLAEPDGFRHLRDRRSGQSAPGLAAQLRSTVEDAAVLDCTRPHVVFRLG